MSKTIRYAINSTLCTNQWVKKYSLVQDLTNPIDVPDNKSVPIFVDILEKTYYSTKVRMYFINGDVIVGYIANQPYQHISIINEHLFFDGRFNTK